MKKIILFTSGLLLLGAASYAQLSRGTILLGGSLGGNTFQNNVQYFDQTHRTANSSFSFQPNLGFFLGDNFVLGIQPGYGFSGFSGQSTNGSNKSRTNTLNLGPFARLYKSLGEKVAVFGQAAMNVSLGRSRESNWQQASSEPSEFVYNTFGGGVSIQPGLVYFISPRFGIEASIGNIGYGFTRLKARDADQPFRRTSHANFSLQPSAFNLGVQYYVGR